VFLLLRTFLTVSSVTLGLDLDLSVGAVRTVGSNVSNNSPTELFTSSRRAISTRRSHPKKDTWSLNVLSSSDRVCSCRALL